MTDFSRLLQFVDELLPKDEAGDFAAFSKSIPVGEAVAKGYLKESPPYLKDDDPSGYDAAGNALEKSDVVHDLLAYLAEQTVGLHKDKQKIIAGFLHWLEGEIIRGPVERLKNKGKIKEFFNLALNELLKILKENRCVPDPTPPKLREAIEGPFNEAVAEIRPKLRAIEATDQLINDIVGRLYGLADREIETVSSSD